jgi:hypothetical protein
MASLSLCLKDFDGTCSGGQIHKDIRIVFIFTYVVFLGMSQNDLLQWDERHKNCYERKG